MTLKQYKQIRMGVAVFISMVVSTATVQQNIWLALAGVLTGMVVLIIAQKRIKEILKDERMVEVGHKAASYTYIIFTVFMALTSLILMFTAKSEELKILGSIFSYITLGEMLLYSLFYYWFNRQMGGSGDEE